MERNTKTHAHTHTNKTKNKTKTLFIIYCVLSWWYMQGVLLNLLRLRIFWTLSFDLAAHNEWNMKTAVVAFQFSSRRYLSGRSEKPINYAPHPVSLTFPRRSFETVPLFVWLTMAFTLPFKKIVERFLFPCRCPPGDRWCDVLFCVRR